MSRGQIVLHVLKAMLISSSVFLKIPHLLVWTVILKVFVQVEKAEAGYYVHFSPLCSLQCCHCISLFTCWCHSFSLISVNINLFVCFNCAVPAAEEEAPKGYCDFSSSIPFMLPCLCDFSSSDGLALGVFCVERTGGLEVQASAPVTFVPRGDDKRYRWPLQSLKWRLRNGASFLLLGYARALYYYFILEL